MMKKDFKLTDSRKAPARQVEAVKFDISKYLARERRKAPKEGSDFWDFDCRFGPTKESAVEINVADINKSIDRVVQDGIEQFYIEILAKPGHKTKKLL